MAPPSLCNFADDNSQPVFAPAVSRLIKILESESKVVIDWFKKNKMLVNPDKFQAVILDQQKAIILMNVLLLIISN